MAADPVKRTLTMHASPERILEVVTDFDNYPKLQKEIEQASITARDGDGRPTRVAMVTGAMGQKSSSEIEVSYVESGVTWHLLSGDMMTQNDAEWHLSGNDDGTTDVDLTMAISLKWPLPKFMLSQIITKGVNDNLKAVQRLAEAP